MWPPLGSRLVELALIFGKLGIFGFGGPAVHLALVEDEVVSRRGWLSRERFLDIVGATNLIPGPNSTEVVIHIGLLRAGMLGLWVAGLSFITPAVVISALFGWVYVRYGSAPDLRPLFEGIQPAVVVLIVAAVVKLGRTALKGPEVTAVGVAVLVASLLGVDEIVALAAGGLLGAVALWLRGRGSRGSSGLSPEGSPEDAKAAERGGGPPAVGGWLVGAKGSWFGTALAGAAGAVPLTLTSLGLFFLQVGSVLYGTGYVLVAFLEGGLVTERGWLTSEQLFDAIAVGQFTPGPLLSTASFIGFVLAGPQGAVVASTGIFLPSFVFVAVLGSVLARMRRWTVAGYFLDAVNASALGLMAATCGHLGSHAFDSWWTWGIGLGAAYLVMVRRVSGIRVIIAAALLGWAIAALGVE